MNKMENKKYNTVGTVSISNSKLAETEVISIPLKHVDDNPLTLLAWHMLFNKKWRGSARVKKIFINHT